MCVFHVNGPNRFGAKSIGIGFKSHVNVVIDIILSKILNAMFCEDAFPQNWPWHLKIRILSIYNNFLLLFLYIYIYLLIIRYIIGKKANQTRWKKRESRPYKLVSWITCNYKSLIYIYIYISFIKEISK